jgi:Protein of unknown function DUF2834
MRSSAEPHSSRKNSCPDRISHSETFPSLLSKSSGQLGRSRDYARSDGHRSNVAGSTAFLTELRQGWGSLTVALDLVFLGIPVVAFAVIESRRLGMRAPWIWAVLAIPLPGAFLIPLFFLLRERALLRVQAFAD